MISFLDLMWRIKLKHSTGPQNRAIRTFFDVLVAQKTIAAKADFESKRTDYLTSYSFGPHVVNSIREAYAK